MYWSLIMTGSGELRGSFTVNASLDSLTGRQWPSIPLRIPRAALIEFRTRYNHQWILQRLNYRTPVQARHDFTLELLPAA